MPLTRWQCVYEEQASKPIQEYRFVEESSIVDGAPSASIVDCEYAESIQKIEVLLDRLSTTTNMLKAQLGTSSHGGSVETGSPESSFTARQQSGFVSDMWSSMQQDVSQLHAILSNPGANLSSDRSESISPLDSIHKQRTDHMPGFDDFDWGGLEQFFPELQSPAEPGDNGRTDQNARS
ncbi:hypothetical protein Slin15195_G078820 [Septoria linicola]|uniref:Uncharacterized protein n=1 Tax=Septoria linicola TaxID=215465 RepID=A0A9Q9AWP8_9PEZI|nr:hypothetical protein Slin14017_G040020 [Septoria linicola]USW54563.1 hypothetical protein Slin15195_G078820 [Septoria linicola]